MNSLVGCPVMEALEKGKRVHEVLKERNLKSGNALGLQMGDFINRRSQYRN